MALAQDAKGVVYLSVAGHHNPKGHTMNTATAAQIKYIESLKAERDLAGADAALEAFRQAWTQDMFSGTMASSMIDWLKTLPRKPRETATHTPAPEGMHRLNGEIYKVQKAIYGSGYPYAKRLVVVDFGCGQCGGDHACSHTPSASRYSVHFEVAPGAVRMLSQATLMTLEEAKQFGALYGTCCVCGRTLTDEVSIAAGIGPVCSNRFTR